MKEHLKDDTYMKPCSTHDCTGLIPGGPVSEEELEDYEELYPFLPKIPESSMYQTEKKNATDQSL